MKVDWTIIFFLHHSIIFFLKGWENLHYELGIERVNIYPAVMQKSEHFSTTLVVCWQAFVGVYSTAYENRLLTKFSIVISVHHIALYYISVIGIQSLVVYFHIYMYTVLRTKMLCILVHFRTITYRKVPVATQTGYNSATWYINLINCGQVFLSPLDNHTITRWVKIAGHIDGIWLYDQNLARHAVHNLHLFSVNMIYREWNTVFSLTR